MKRGSTLSVRSEKPPAYAQPASATSASAAVATTGNAAPSKASESEAKHRGAAEGPVSKQSASTVSALGKFYKMRPLTKREARERREQERKHKALLEEFGVTEEELREWGNQHEVDGREAAVEDVGDVEHCRDLAGEFARESAWRTGDAISNVRDRYELIVEELLAVRYVQGDGGRYSLSQVLLSECGTDKALKEFLQHLGKWIKAFALRYYIYGLPHNTWVVPGSEIRAIKTLRGRSVSESMMKALAVEHEREPEALMRFLWAVFKRWRKIEEPDSVFRQHLLVHQLSGTSKEIAEALQEIGAVATSTTEGHLRSLRLRVRQYRSRDKKAALRRRRV
jgi:hypothetical protein